MHLRPGWRLRFRMVVLTLDGRDGRDAQILVNVGQSGLQAGEVTPLPMEQNMDLPHNALETVGLLEYGTGRQSSQLIRVNLPITYRMTPGESGRGFRT